MQKIALYRILGNDLPPRHAVGQTVTNLEFIFKNEPQFENVEKRWVVNRVISPKQEKAIIGMLELHNQPYIHIPFDREKYLKLSRRRRALLLPPSLWSKTKHLINLNDARNRAIEEGSKIADWVMPFDGNCCFTEDGMKRAQDVLSRADRGMYCIPIYRLLDNAAYFNFSSAGYVQHEPQVVISRHEKARFNETFSYGNESKVSFLRKQFRVNTAGYTNAAFILNDANFEAGYVLRLFSGVREGEADHRVRVRLRKQALQSIITQVEQGAGAIFE
jgi:hypothetical protein